MLADQEAECNVQCLMLQMSKGLGIYLTLTGPNYISNWISAEIIKLHLLIIGCIVGYRGET